VQASNQSSTVLRPLQSAVSEVSVSTIHPNEENSVIQVNNKQPNTNSTESLMPDNEHMFVDISNQSSTI